MDQPGTEEPHDPTRRSWHRKWQTVREQPLGVTASVSASQVPPSSTVHHGHDQKRASVDSEALQAIIAENYKRLETLHPRPSDENLSTRSSVTDKKKRHSFKGRFRKERGELSTVNSEYERTGTIAPSVSASASLSAPSNRPYRPATISGSSGQNNQYYQSISEQIKKEKADTNTKDKEDKELIEKLTKMEGRLIGSPRSFDPIAEEDGGVGAPPSPNRGEGGGGGGGGEVKRRGWYNHYNSLKEDKSGGAQKTTTTELFVATKKYTDTTEVSPRKDSDTNSTHSDDTRVEHSGSETSSPPVSPKNRRSTNQTELSLLSTPSSSSTISNPATPSSSTQSNAPSVPIRELTVREKYIKEIIETEDAYIKDMKMVIKNFVAPLKSDQIISKEDINKIFSNLEDLVKVNELLFADFPSIDSITATPVPPVSVGKTTNTKTRGRADSSDSDSDSYFSSKKKKKDVKKETPPPPAPVEADKKIGDAFLKVADFLKVYASYCTNQQTSLDTLSRLKTEIPEFSTWLTYVQSFPECRNLDLGSFLIKPIQRICKYPLLLRDLLKHTEPGKSSYLGLQNAEGKLEKIVAEINEKKRRAENQLKLTQISQTLVGVPPPETGFQLIVPSRRFVAEGLVKINHKEKFCFVFNDILIIAARSQALLAGATGNKKEAFRFKAWIKLGYDTISPLEVASTDTDDGINVSASSASIALNMSAIGMMPLASPDSFYVIINSKKKICECTPDLKSKIFQTVKENHLTAIERKAAQVEPEGVVRLKVYYQNRPEIIEKPKDELIFDELIISIIPEIFQLPPSALWVAHYKKEDGKFEVVSTQEDFEQIVAKGVRDLYLY